jgi:hypothetical protein
VTDQAHLFDPDQPVAHARRGDPETSHQAAASITPAKLRRSQAWVLLVFEHYPRLHDEELVHCYDMLGLPAQSVSGLRTRRRELVDQGYLADSGERVRLVSGRLSIVWERTARWAER